MKLISVITRRIALVAFIILSLWSVCFYFILINEINDEVDDSLEDYAEMIIIRFVRNEELPTTSNGSNNQFFLQEISPEQAATRAHIRYEDQEVYIEEKDEFEPARVLTYIFNDDSGNFYELQVSTPYIDKADLRQYILFWILFLFFAILVCMITLNVWTIHRSFSPLRKLLKWLENYRIGKNNEPLNNHTNIHEFKLLNRVVSESIQRTEESYKQQKIFIGNVSHEMQTPLAICNNRLEMLLEDDRLTEEQMNEIIKTRQTINHLSHINRSLLLLTKIDNGLFNETNTIRLEQIIEEQIPDFQKAYDDKNITLTFEVSAPFSTEMEESLAQTLISNLLKNAFVHNIIDGVIHVIVNSQKIVFKNTGTPQSLDQNLIFEHFYHASGNPSSLGLGLSLVKAICERYGMQINYTFENPYHNFIITKTRYFSKHNS